MIKFENDSVIYFDYVVYSSEDRVTMYNNGYAIGVLPMSECSNSDIEFIENNMLE